MKVMSDPIAFSFINGFGFSIKLRDFIPSILPINAQKNLFLNADFFSKYFYLHS